MLPNPISSIRYKNKNLIFFSLRLYDIEAHICPSKRAYCHAFKTQHFALYESCCLSQFIAFFIDQETKLSRALFFSLFYRLRFSKSSVPNFFLSDVSRFLISPYRFKVYRINFFNDPSAGSPTETLLRLILPLDIEI